ncbi:MAG: hypothetical protein ACLP7Q_02920 [Isosphaeraceae bacterium]
MQREVLAPGVLHREHADLGPKVFRVRGHREAGFRDSPHEQVVDHAGAEPRYRAESAGRVKTMWKYGVSSRSPRTV